MAARSNQRSSQRPYPNRIPANVKRNHACHTKFIVLVKLTVKVFKKDETTCSISANLWYFCPATRYAASKKSLQVVFWRIEHKISPSFARWKMSRLLTLSGEMDDVFIAHTGSVCAVGDKIETVLSYFVDNADLKHKKTLPAQSHSGPTIHWLESGRQKEG